MSEMFCFQCQQTAGGSGCVKTGVCGKQPETAHLQDALVCRLVGVAGFEPAASWSRTKRATNCATPRHSRFIIISIFPSVKREIARSGANPGVRPIPPAGSGR